MSEAALAVSGLTKNFGGLRVTDDVTLDVAPGELLAIIGPNGAGKTTLVHQISGMLAPDKGIVALGGNDVTAMTPSARARAGMARSFQITSILPQFTALENVALAVQARSGSSFRFWRPAARERMLNDDAMAALTRVGLQPRASIVAGTLSHGEKRALEIAIALAMHPRVLLLDEPMAGTGHDESARLTELLLTLKGQLAIVLVEHDMQAVFALADRIAVLVYGKVIACGAPDAIRADPNVRAAYLGDEMQADTTAGVTA